MRSEDTTIGAENREGSLFHSKYRSRYHGAKNRATVSSGDVPLVTLSRDLSRDCHIHQIYVATLYLSILQQDETLFKHS